VNNFCMIQQKFHNPIIIARLLLPTLIVANGSHPSCSTRRRNNEYTLCDKEIPPAVDDLALVVLEALPSLPQNRFDRDDDDDVQKSSTPPGPSITPTALHHSFQQVLNPGLANYPNFVAGEAVKAVVSPDGKTLAILTAGMNSLYFPNVGEPSTN